MRLVVHFLVISILLFSCKQEKSNGYDIKDFGAKGDSITINTKFIQNTIDKCAEDDCGIVFISGGTFITGTILLKDNITLLISEDAKLIGSANSNDYRSIDAFVDATGQIRGNCLIGAKNATNIAIRGNGIIDGNGAAFQYKNIKQKIKELNISKNEQKKFGKNRPFLLRFVGSSNITLEDINLKQAAAWACHFYQSNNIKVNNISIFSHANFNNDGIDLDSSYDVKITNSNIDTGDDAICVKATSPKPSYNIDVSNCKLKSDWGALKFGTESMGDFYNINIKDCNIHDTKGGGIKILSVDGANINNVKIDNITMENVDMPIFFRLGERLRTYRNAEKQNVGSIKNVSISNVKATARSLKQSRVASPSGIFITGTPNFKIDDIRLENINITLPGNHPDFKSSKIEELEKNYPEYIHFKSLPAYGLYGRHIKKLTLKNVDFALTNNDIREKIILNDVNQKVIE